MNAKSHPGPRSNQHRWKITFKDKRLTTFQCCDCPLMKRSRINFQGGFPNTVYTLPGGAEFGRAPACQPLSQPNIEECVIDVEGPL